MPHEPRDADPDTVTLHVPFRVVKRGVRKEMQLPEGATRPRRTDGALVKALGHALESGEFATIAELAEREGIAPRTRPVSCASRWSHRTSSRQAERGDVDAKGRGKARGLSEPTIMDCAVAEQLRRSNCEFKDGLTAALRFTGIGATDCPRCGASRVLGKQNVIERYAAIAPEDSDGVLVLLERARTAETGTKV